MSIETAITTLAAALANIATAGDNIAVSINRYCELTENQDRMLFESMQLNANRAPVEGAKHNTLDDTVEAVEADPIGDAILADREAAAQERKAAFEAEKAEAKAGAAKLVADTKAITDKAKAEKAKAEAQTKADEITGITNDEAQNDEVAKTKVDKKATYDETRAVLIEAVTKIGKAPVADMLKDNFQASNIKGLTEEQNYKFIDLLKTTMSVYDAD